MKLIKNGEVFPNVVYKTSNVLVQQIQMGTKKERCYIIGNGHSLELNCHDRVIKHEPFTERFNPKISKEHTVFAFYFTYECAGLCKASEDLAEFINRIGKQGKLGHPILVGHSKCGVCLSNATHYLGYDVTLVTISAPFSGTPVTNMEYVEAKLKSKLLIWIYKKIFSNHNVDKDIMPNSKFIRQLMLHPRCIKHVNIVSKLPSSLYCKNLIDMVLLFLDKRLQINGDGIVPLKSQHHTLGITTEIYCSYASSLEKGLALLDSFL